MDVEDYDLGCFHIPYGVKGIQEAETELHKVALQSLLQTNDFKAAGKKNRGDKAPKITFF